MSSLEYLFFKKLMQIGIAKKPVDKLRCNSIKQSINSIESRKEEKRTINRLDKLKINNTHTTH